MIYLTLLIKQLYTIKNEKISELKVSKFNTEHAKYTTLKRSTLIEFLKEEIYNQHLKNL